ncbi:MAG TPA: hypothetical protein VNW92_11380 [Polyangiaceae bacterium]|nr:hypothetical protein [Polyangiaceae bacterium]
MSLTAVSFLLAGCARTYRVSTPEVVERGAIRVAVDEVRSAAPYADRDVEVSLRSGARAATSLRGALLSRALDAPCQSGKAFSEVAADGVVQTEGPLDLAGSHRLKIAFSDAARKLPQGPVALDLQLGIANGNACARVPLFGTADSPNYQMDETSAGISLSLGGRGVFPVTNTARAGIENLGLVDTRLGAAFGSNRIWAEFAGGAGASKGYSDHILALGADRALWQSGPLAFMLGAGYEVVFDLYRAPGATTSSRRYLLHGPRLTPSLSFSLLSSSAGFHGLSAGRRTVYLELEAPSSLWFGTGSAPDATLAPGVGLSLFGAL